MLPYAGGIASARIASAFAGLGSALIVGVLIRIVRVVRLISRDPGNVIELRFELFDVVIRIVQVVFQILLAFPSAIVLFSPVRVS